MRVGTPPGEWSPVVDRALERFRGVRAALLPVLHDVHDALGWIPPDSLESIARGLNLSLAEVHGVVTFYHDFRSEPPGRHVLRVCRAEACQAMGSDALADRVRERTGAGMGETTSDGSLTVEPVYCLGNCACSPAVMFDGRLEGRVTGEKMDAILESARKGP